MKRTKLDLSAFQKTFFSLKNGKIVCYVNGSTNQYGRNPTNIVITYLLNKKCEYKYLLFPSKFLKEKQNSIINDRFGVLTQHSK